LIPECGLRGRSAASSTASPRANSVAYTVITTVLESPDRPQPGTMRTSVGVTPVRVERASWPERAQKDQHDWLRHQQRAGEERRAGGVLHPRCAHAARGGQDVAVPERRVDLVTTPAWAADDPPRPSSIRPRDSTIPIHGPRRSVVCSANGQPVAGTRRVHQADHAGGRADTADRSISSRRVTLCLAIRQLLSLETSFRGPLVAQTSIGRGERLASGSEAHERR
jgi:hypothetical protein